MGDVILQGNQEQTAPIGDDIAATDAGATSAIGDVFLFTLVMVGVFALFAGQQRGLADGDTSWHIAAGRWIWENGAVPSVDPFSFSAKGRAWTAHEWLIEIPLYWAYRLAGWSGSLALAGAALAGMMAIIANYLRRWFPPVRVALVATILIAGLAAFMLARPHVFAWLLLSLWVIQLLRAREAGRVPHWTNVLIIALWANLHASFLMGLVIAAALGLEALIEAKAEDRRAVFTGWLTFGLLAGLAGLATPSGIQTYLFPLQVSSMKALTEIGEWQHTSFATFSLFQAILLGGMFLLLVKPVRVPVIRLLLMLFLLYLALKHIRHQAVFLIVSVLILAEPIARSFALGAALPMDSIWRAIRSRAKELAPLLGMAALLLGGAVVARLLIPVKRDNIETYPASAIAALPAGFRTENGLNEYSFGGPLILARVPVFVDGRADMYGDSFTIDYTDIVNKGNLSKWRAANAKWKFAWTMLPPDKPLVRWLDKQPDWQRFYADKWAVIHVTRAKAQALGLKPLLVPAPGKSRSPAPKSADKATTG